MIRLFIENKEIEITDDIQVAITKEFEDLSNPTTIINDWSKTVSIPFTAKNNEIFGHIYNPNKAIVDGGTVGIYFNPLLKLDFRLEWCGAVMMMGYAKLNEVKQVSGNGTYEVTLFGQLGKIFQELKKITFDTTTEDTDYLIDGSVYVDEVINKQLVYNSWTSTGQTYSDLYPKYVTTTGGTRPHSRYNVTDIIGFAPNNSFSDGFNYKSYQYDKSISKEFTESLGTGFTQDTGCEPDTVIPDGLLPREIGEYRSYLQLPYIYWNKLFQMFQKKAEEVTGYKFNLDATWFTNSNPYWHDLVYMLNSLNLKQEVSATNYYKFASFGITWGGDISEYVTTKSTDVGLQVTEEVIPIVEANEQWIDLTNNYNIVFNTPFTINLHESYYNNLRINPSNGLVFSMAVLDENSVQVEELKYLLVDDQYTGSTSGYEEVIRVSREGSGGWTVYPRLCLTLNKGKYNTDKVRFVLRGVWLNSNAPFLDANNNPFTPTPVGGRGYINLYIYSLQANNPIPCIVIQNVHRSYGHFTMNDLWNNDYNIFSEVIKYCKMYRITISIDELNKKIIFKPYTKLFNTYTVEDWSEKVDKSHDFTITPITFENKYVLFNYEDNKTKMGTEYKEKYGVNYGEYRLTTDYNFNSEVKKIFDKVKTSIVNTDNVLSWTNIYDNHKIIYSFPSEIYVYNKDKDRKQVSVFGSYFFHNGVRSFSTESRLYLRNVFISDDTTFQQGNDTYMYTQSAGERVSVTTYPALDIVRGDNICLFNIPQENYTYLNNYSGKASIYTNFWEKYLDERYNVQNKKITCYVMLKPSEYNQFNWNQLVKIENQLCIVNKIYDYDITSNQPTKVDLITIHDLNGYSSNNYTA